MRTRKARLAKPLFSAIAAGALVVVMATPASADLPDDTDVSIEITGGFIRVNERVFDLGTGDPDDCNPNNDPSTASATVGPANGSGVSAVSNLAFDFQPAEVSDGICATIVGQNSAGGTQDGDGDLLINNPSVSIDVAIPVPFFPNCRLDNITITLSGGVVDGSSPWVADLGAAGFNVPDPTSCGFLASTIEAGFPDGDGTTSNNLPTTDTEADLELLITAVP
jgi:hypothetical protein